MSGTPSRPASSISALQVVHARVHPAARHQPEQVQPPVLRADGAGVAQHPVLEERAVVDRIVDPREVLAHDLAGAEVEVADLGVAHLAVGQADGAARRR